MATTVWGTGGAAGDINDADNWSNGVPGDTDHAIVPRDATQDMDTNMSGLVDTIASWTVEPGCKIKIGASGNQLQVAIARIVYMGEGEMWYHGDAGAVVDTIVEASSPTAIVHIDQTTFTNIRVFRGNVFLDGSIGNVADVHVGYISDRLNDAQLTITANANTITRFEQTGGVVKSTMDMVDFNMNGGQCWLLGTVTATRVQVKGGTFYCNTSGEVTTAVAHAGGTFDLATGSGARDVATLWAYPRSIIRSVRSLVGSDDVSTFEDLRDVA